MKKQEISILINRLYTTKESELICTQVQQLLPAYVETEYEGEALATAVIRDIEAHLHHCPDCTELYQGLYFLVEQEAIGELELEDPPHPTLPPHREPGTLTPVAGS